MAKKIQQKKKPEKKILSDNELIKIIRSKNQEKYSFIMERYHGKLFSYLYRLIGNKEEVEDILQDVFIKTFRNLKSYDTRKKFSSWIYRIAHNEAINHIKRKSLKKFISWEDISSTKDKLELSESSNVLESIWIRKEETKKVNKALDILPLKYKQVLILRYYSDKSYDEIASILEKPVNTVGTLINRAKKRLQKVIEKLEKK